MIKFVHEKLKEFFSDFCLNEETVGFWLFVSWVVISFIGWFIFARAGYYLLFGLLHLWLFPKIFGMIGTRVAMGFLENEERMWFVVGSFVISVIFCLAFVGLSSLGLYSQLFIHLGKSGYSLRGINLFKEYINFFNFFDLRWRSDVFNSATYFKAILWSGTGLLPAVYTCFGIWRAEEELDRERSQVEKIKKERIKKIKEEERRIQVEEDRVEVKKAVQEKRKRDLENGNIFGSGFLD